VAEHSDYRGDPWGRLQRTSTFLAVTTFGTANDAQRAVDKVRGIHRRVHGVAPDGRAYRADDPHLLEWVHIAEIDSFLLAHRLYGAKPLDQSGRDAYVSDTARVASALGVVDPPQTEAELRERIAAVRPELHRLALVAGFLSVASFLVLARLSSAYNPELTTVVRADWLALALLVAGAAAHWWPFTPRSG
jgi:uncharacterized protein (DUF2236 family)